MLTPLMTTRNWKFVGGEIALDFTNTMAWHASDEPEERLTSYEDLVHWSLQAGILEERGAGRLLEHASCHPDVAQKMLRRAISIREALYKIFLAVAEGKAPPPREMESLNYRISDAFRRLRLVPKADGFVWEFGGDPLALDRMLWSVLRSATDLLSSQKRDRIRQCADDRGCGWFFLDNSKNHSRRWCDMRECGNRAKAQRHYQRQCRQVGEGEQCRT